MALSNRAALMPAMAIRRGLEELLEEGVDGYDENRLKDWIIEIQMIIDTLRN